MFNIAAIWSPYDFHCNADFRVSIFKHGLFGVSIHVVSSHTSPTSAQTALVSILYRTVFEVCPPKLRNIQVKYMIISIVVYIIELLRTFFLQYFSSLTSKTTSLKKAVGYLLSTSWPGFVLGIHALAWSSVQRCPD